MQNVIHVMTGDMKGVHMIMHVLLLFRCFKSNQIHVNNFTFVGNSQSKWNGTIASVLNFYVTSAGLSVPTDLVCRSMCQVFNHSLDLVSRAIMICM